MDIHHLIALVALLLTPACFSSHSPSTAVDDEPSDRPTPDEPPDTTIGDPFPEQPADETDAGPEDAGYGTDDYWSEETEPENFGSDPACAAIAEACTCGDGTASIRGCWPDGSFGDCRCPTTDDSVLLRELRSHMVGSWSGTRWTPWTAESSVVLGFLVDGTYVSEGPDGTTFYWGFDRLSPKHWRLDDVTAEGLGVGQLEVLFESGGSQWGALEDLEFSADYSRLTFKFFDTWGDGGRHGPVELVLERQE